MRPCAVIFDLDGTLIDSAPAIFKVSNMVLAARGFAPLTEAQVRSFVGQGVQHLVRCLLQNAGEDPDGPMLAPMVADLVNHYETEVEGNRPYEGVRAALETLAAAGHPLGICTNKPYRPAIAALRHVGLLDFFPVVLGGDSLASRKPDPEMLFATHAQLAPDLPVLYVGDSEIDAQTAQAAALPFALYTEGYRKTPVAEMRHAVAFSDYAMLPGIAAADHWS